MIDPQWQLLLRVVQGQPVDPLPVGLIVDSPWLPGWAGISILDYFADPRAWLEANVRAAERFAPILFLPGFWSEFGMCTEPSAFGVKCIWYENAFPSVERMLGDYAEIARLKKPNCRSDGLLPLVVKRLAQCGPAMEKAGHAVRFAVARGPLNIASYLLGHTEFLLGIKTNPAEIHQLLALVAEFLVDWVRLQKELFASIEGIFLLDDLIGFLRDDDFQEFALPYLKQVFDALDVPVKFLHNDAFGLVTAAHLRAMGVNLFNFSFNHSLSDIRRLAGETVTLLGNIPPRDVLAQATPEEVRCAVAAMLDPVADRRRLIVSCGGGAPPGVSTENLEALAGPWKCRVDFSPPMTDQSPTPG
jgi:uroporphyrinogen decarboxylase